FAGVDEGIVLIELLQPGIAGGDKSASAEAELIELHSCANEDREGLRDDLDVKPAVVAPAHALEFVSWLGDEACEDVQPAGGALGVGDSVDVGREREALHE